MFCCTRTNPVHLHNPADVQEARDTAYRGLFFSERDLDWNSLRLLTTRRKGAEPRGIATMSFLSLHI